MLLFLLLLFCAIAVVALLPVAFHLICAVIDSVRQVETPDYVLSKKVFSQLVFLSTFCWLLVFIVANVSIQNEIAAQQVELKDYREANEQLRTKLAYSQQLVVAYKDSLKTLRADLDREGCARNSNDR